MKTLLLTVFLYSTFLTFSASAATSEAIVFPTFNSLPPLNPKSFDKATNSVNFAAFRLLDPAKYELPEGNWMVSPLSLAAVLGQLMLGARGDFRRILGEILSPDKEEIAVLTCLEVHQQLGGLLNLLQDSRWTQNLIQINSALFILPEIKLKLSYKHALSDIYNVHICPTNFSEAPVESMKAINAWVNKATLGEIPQILEDMVAPTTASLYLNTVYFKAAWKIPFDVNLTKLGAFFISETEKVMTEFMAGEVEVKLYEDPALKCTLIGIPYTDSSTYFYAVLPFQDSSSRFDLSELASRLTYDRMTTMITHAESKNVTLTLPKVKLSSALSLKRPMVRAITRRRLNPVSNNVIRETRGVEENLSMFLSNSYRPSPLPLKIDDGEVSGKQKITFNMGSASDDFRFKIDDVLHRVEMEINEQGTEAVAVSSTLVDYFGGTILRVNRPFMFLIRHEVTGVHLFWGAVRSPTPSE